MELMAWTYTLVVLFGALGILAIIEEIIYRWFDRWGFACASTRYINFVL